MIFDEKHVIYRYKYLPFSEGSLKTLTDSTIKFTCPLEFNDPFDCLPHYDTTSIEQLPHMRPDLFKAAGDRRGLSPAKRIQEKGKFVARLRNRIDDGSFARDLLGGVGVVSLSKNALSIPMWSHYADFHRGLVLEFRIPRIRAREDVPLAIDRLVPFPVRYETDRPHLKAGIEHPRDLVDKVILTKSLDWEYEQEERVIDQVRGPGIYKYRRDEILCSVIAGLKMSEDDYLRLQSIVRGQYSSIPNLMLYRARAKIGEYKLEISDHPRLAVSEVAVKAKVDRKNT
jgi:hypothetical protein